MMLGLCCEKDDDATDDQASIVLESVTGVVQKGPFINGTQIQMHELGSALNQTGRSFTTEVNSDIGSFEITDIVHMEAGSCYNKLPVPTRQGLGRADRSYFYI